MLNLSSPSLRRSAPTRGLYQPLGSIPKYIDERRVIDKMGADEAGSHMTSAIHRWGISGYLLAQFWMEIRNATTIQIGRYNP